MTRILLINQGHTNNIGDQAIDAVLDGFLAAQGHTVVHAPYETRVEDRFSLPFDHTDITPRIIMRIPPVMNHLNHKRIKDVISDIGPLDAAVIGGGELLANHRGFNSALVIWCRELHARRIPILLTGVSGNYAGGINARYYKEALNLCSYVSVRDHSTEQILANKYGVHCEYAPDVVFSYTKVFPGLVDLQQNRTQELCVPVEFDKSQFTSMHLANEREYIAYLAQRLMDHVDDPHVTVTSTIMDDVRYPQYIAKELQRYGLNTQARTGEDLDGFIALLPTTSRVLSARMHACILGLLFGCEIAPIPFREKLVVFGKEYHSVDDIHSVIEASYTGLIRLNEVITSVAK